MSGTKSGGVRTRETNKKKYGKDFYKEIGAMGGQTKSPLKGFGTRRDIAAEAGRKGGTISKRGPKQTPKEVAKQEESRQKLLHLLRIK
mgnify:CR=1 FL=1